MVYSPCQLQGIRSSLSRATPTYVTATTCETGSFLRLAICWGTECGRFPEAKDSLLIPRQNRPENAGTNACGALTPINRGEKFESAILPTASARKKLNPSCFYERL